VRILKAVQADIEDVAKLHIQVFPGFFLTSLGASFLKELYAGFLSHSSGIFLVAKEEGRVVGFVAGTSSPKVFFSDLRRRRCMAFVIKATPSIFRNPLPVCRKLFYAATYRGDAPVARPSAALLSSIGISHLCRGAGVAGSLMIEFENESVKRGVEHIYLTTDALDNDRVNVFYRKQGYEIVTTFQQNGGRDMFRYEKQLSVRI
jgi:ribosomal protein S18 acetylase RimI-like enzyme